MLFIPKNVANHAHFIRNTAIHWKMNSNYEPAKEFLCLFFSLCLFNLQIWHIHVFHVDCHKNTRSFLSWMEPIAFSQETVFRPILSTNIMEWEFKQCWSSISPISTKRPPPNKQSTTCEVRNPRPGLERDKHMAGLNWLMRFHYHYSPSPPTHTQMLLDWPTKVDLHNTNKNTINYNFNWYF